MGPYKLCYYSCCPTTSQKSLVLTCGNDYTAHPFKEQKRAGLAMDLYFNIGSRLAFLKATKWVKEFTELLSSNFSIHSSRLIIAGLLE